MATGTGSVWDKGTLIAFAGLGLTALIQIGGHFSDSGKRDAEVEQLAKDQAKLELKLDSVQTDRALKLAENLQKHAETGTRVSMLEQMVGNMAKSVERVEQKLDSLIRDRKSELQVEDGPVKVR